MNIQQEALHHFLQGCDIKSEYFYHEDYKVICDKSLAYKNKNKSLPSVNFLLEYVNKLSDDKEQVDRVEDLLYVASKYKPELNTIYEVNELLLENFKKENIRDYTKALAKNLTEGNEGKVQYYADKISEINKLQLNGEDFRANDIKSDLDKGSLKVELIDSGFLPTAHESVSKIARGSLISLIADTGFGKSLLSLNACVNQYLNGNNVVYLSYELPKPVVLARIISFISSVPIKEVMSEEYTMDESELRIKSAKAVLEYEIDFEKAFNRILKKKTFEDCKRRDNYLKVVAIQSSGQHEVDDLELPDNEGILSLLDEYTDLDFFHIDLISEVQFRKSVGNYESDLSGFARELKAKALKHSSVIIIISQPSGSSPQQIRFPKYAKSLRSSSDSNLIISSTPEMLQDNIAVLLCEKCRHSRNGLAIPMERHFETMGFRHMNEEQDLSVEAYLTELGKTIKTKEK